MHAEIVAIGSELVHGEKLDTNSQWLSRRLNALGIGTRYFSVVGDDMGDVLATLSTAVGRARLVIIGGGLGPTQDDLTREALAKLAGVPLEQDADALQALEAFFARRNRAMPERNRVQALVPKGAEVVPNRTGTAPGLWMPVGDAIVVCLPGVPSELKAMFEEEVAPRLRALQPTGQIIVHRVINLFGLGESEVEAQAQDLTARGRVPEVGITAHDATISFRVAGTGAEEAAALAQIEPTLAAIRERFGELIVGEREGEDVAEALLAELVRTGRTLAAAESCTGGLIAHRLTTVPGASDVFPGGVVSYSNASKTALLGVPAELIEAHGAVSAPVAEAMARGTRDRFAADLGLSVTGVAGPGGGSPDKPVGLVFVGLANAHGVHTRRLELGPEQPRHVIQSRAAKHAMNWVRLHLKRKEV